MAENDHISVEDQSLSLLQIIDSSPARLHIEAFAEQMRERPLPRKGLFRKHHGYEEPMVAVGGCCTIR